MANQDQFDRLFGKLPEVMKRGDDGAPVWDESHPAVAAAIAATVDFFKHGGTMEQAETIVNHVFADARARRNSHGR